MAPRQRRPRGHIEPRPNGTFRAIVYAGIDPLTSRPRYLRKTMPTYAEAEVELTRLQNQVDERRHPRSSITVSEVIEKWLEVAKLEDSTRERYDGLIRNYITPRFGSRPAAQLDVETLDRFYARLQLCNQLCSGTSRHECRPLSASSIRQIHFILRAALNRAVRWRYLSTNEAALAEPPAFDRPDPDPPSAEEAAALVNEAWREPWWGLCVWLIMVTGCRRSELCALRWTDVDLDRAVIAISRSYSQTKSRRREKTTKSRQKRRLSLDAYTVELLTAYREQCRKHCDELSVPLARDAFVFSGSPDYSTPLLPSTVTQRYRRLAKRAGLRSTRIHALRHYSATELLNAGVDLRTVAGRLGHGSGGATTLRHYAAWVEEVDKRAANAIAGTIPRPDPSRRTPRNPYEKLAAELRTAIQSGDLPLGTALPTAPEIAAAHSVSTGTVSRALGLLKDEGLIDVRRGRRAIVISLPDPSADAPPS